METINERFRKAREETGLSMEKFAKKANRTQSEIKNIEYAKTTPKDEVIASVCLAHKINENWLRTGEGEPFIPQTREENITELVEKSLSGGSDFQTAVVKMICSRTDEELKVLEAAFRIILENLKD